MKNLLVAVGLQPAENGGRLFNAKLDSQVLANVAGAGVLDQRSHKLSEGRARRIGRGGLFQKAGFVLERDDPNMPVYGKSLRLARAAPSLGNAL